jgi:ABC-type lipoprotein release transport system permease subunit
VAKPVEQQIQLPLVKAVEIAWKNIHIRWWRSILVTSGIILAIAFLTYILSSETINKLADAAVNAKLGVAGTSALDAISQQSSQTQTWWLVGLALIISFVGILNSMLMSVTERFSEIGTMKCLGALDSFIIKLFLLESAFQGMVGTTLGISIGVALVLAQGLVTYGTALFVYLPLIVLFKIIVLCLVSGTFLTVAGALYPAWRASRMQPVDAMRWEV